MLRPMILMLVAVGVVFGAVFGLKWFGMKMMNEAVNAAPLPTETVSTVTIARETWPNEIQAVGNVVVFRGVDVTTEAAGMVEQIHVGSGESVREGQLMVTLDSANEQAEYQRLVAVAELAELSRVRREKLYKLDSIAKSDYDTTASEAKAAKAAVAAQAARLAQKQIRAPFSGRIGIVLINPGQYLNPGTPISSLTAQDPLEFAFSLPERWLGHVEQGHPVTVNVDLLPERSFEGTVLAFEPRVKEATRDYRLHARLPNPDGALRPGQFGKVTLKLAGEREVMPIPRTAINYDSYGSSVWVVVRKPAADDAGAPQADAGAEPATSENLSVEKRFVRTGEARGDFVVVEQGLEAGEEVVTSGLFKLRNGQPIAIDNTNAPNVELAPAPGPG